MSVLKVIGEYVGGDSPINRRRVVGNSSAGGDPPTPCVCSQSINKHKLVEHRLLLSHES